MIMRKVSIVIPIYNAGHALVSCLDSICAQTYHNLQIILIDDGSQDDSLAICQRYAAMDQRIKVLSHSNHGVSFARNCGLDAADGDFLMFVDADDQILPDYVHCYVTAAEESQADIVVGGIRFCEQAGKTYDLCPDWTGTMDQRQFMEKVCLCRNGLFGYVANKLYRLPLIKGHHIRFCESMAAQEDMEFALSAYQKGKRFFTFLYTGYLYDYDPSGRVVPVADLLQNQQKLLRSAIQAGCGRQSLEAAARKLSDMTYSALFHCRSSDEIQTIAEIFGLKEDIQNVSFDRCEKRIVLRWFLAGSNQRIARYFRLRNGVKRILGKK